MAGAPPLPARLLWIAVCVLLLPTAAHAARQLADSSPSPDAAADALLKLKSGIKDDAGVLRNWSPGTRPCAGAGSSWAGVICHKGEVTGLQLENMALSGTIDLRPLKGLRGLRSVSFMDNQFTGPMPDVNELPGLRAIFLSGNKFSGEIPADAFDGMSSLKKVALSKNNFSGPIPASLAGVPRLMDLLLDDNKFQGKIPDLPQKELKVVNVANNELEGEIPASLKSMGAAMFAGNKKLCGGLLDQKCAAPPTSLTPAPAKTETPPSSPPPAPAKTETPPSSDKGGAQPSTPAVPAAHKTTGPPADKATQDAAPKEPTEGSMSYGFLVAILGVLALLGFALLALQRRRREEEFEEHMRRLGRLSHPNLLPLVAYYYRKEEKLLMHDYVQNKSLAHLLHGEGRGVKKAVVHWAARLKIIKGVASALSYMYDELPMLTVPHGHLKSSNILLDERFEPLMTDYALVPVMNQSHAAQLMVAFKSPERKQFGKSSKKSDVWCLGLLILEILTGRPPSYDLKASAAPEQEQQNPNDLAGLVASTPEENWLRKVVDPDLRFDDEAYKAEAGWAVKLIKIGLACCDGNAESRSELKDAGKGIEERKAKGRGDREDNSFYSSISDGTERDEDFTNVAIH
uniref:Putative LRR receptor-like serine/threonine-protein kinase n=1 Tax=Aegilops tauschii TaxID=37682 RepID=M8BCT5_AEGTA